ncbi:MAG: macro domain-containing protein [Deltaproteobacteria bacterium]|nr:macro domain-containing protein [Deltaproteobacteria bacterium]
MGISYVIGDATYPVGSGTKVIVHVCNDVGAWGKGFVLALSKRWKAPETMYMDWYKGRCDISFTLGEVQFVKVEDDIYVANVIGQKGLRKVGGIPPVRYNAIEEGLRKVADFAIEDKASIHMPRIGCGLAGGSWDKVEDIINKELIARSIPVTVYDYRLK